MVSVIDSEEKLAKLIPQIDAMVTDGLIAISEVEVIKHVHKDGVGAQTLSGGGLDRR